MLTLADVLEALTGVRLPDLDQVIPEAVVSAERVSPGSFFINLDPNEENGVAKVEQAINQGAILCLGSFPLPDGYRSLDLTQPVRPGDFAKQAVPLCLIVEDAFSALQKIARFWRDKISPKIICITGTVGKTTTKDLVAEILGQRYRTLQNYAQLEANVEIPLTMLHLTSGHQRVIFEIGFDALDVYPDLVSLLAPHIVVVTTLGRKETGPLISPEEHAQNKSALLRSIPDDGVAIVNIDDPWVRAISHEISSQSFSYGLNPQADVWADNVEGLGLDGISFNLHYGPDQVQIQVPLIGRHSVHTALRATAVGLLEGLTWNEIIQGLRFGQAQLRLVAVRTKSGALILDDTYNASPASTMAALNLLDEMEGRKIAVLGGDEALAYYERHEVEMVGLRAAQVVNHLIVTGENGGLLAAAARSAWFPATAITELSTVPEVIHFLRDLLRENDVVLVKGPRTLGMDTISQKLERRS